MLPFHDRSKMKFDYASKGAVWILHFSLSLDLPLVSSLTKGGALDCIYRGCAALEKVRQTSSAPWGRSNRGQQPPLPRTVS